MKRFAAIALILCFPGLARAAWDYQEYCKALAEAGARIQIDDGDWAGLLIGAGGAPDVAFVTPGWALAALQAGGRDDQVRQALAKVAAAVATKGRDAGLLPWNAGGTPSLSATEMAAPVLAGCVLWGGERLSQETKAALTAALEQIARRLRKAKPEDTDLRTLLLAAACAGVGRAVSDNGLVRRAGDLVGAWLRSARKHGLLDGHGPRVEAGRLAALEWIVRFCDQLPSQIEQARALLWADTLQRLVTPGEMLAGPQLFSSQEDARTAQGPLREILALARGQAAPVDVAHAYYALAFKTAPPLAEPPGPGSLRYTWSADPLVEEYVVVTPGYAMGLQTSPLNGSSVPVHIIWRRAEPLVTYATVSGPCHVSAVPGGSMALVNFDFDAVGRGDRTQVWVDLHIAPRDTLKDVRVVGQQWPGQPVAVDVGVSVAVSFGDRFVGIVPCWAGPAEAKKVTMRVKPGVLQWAHVGGADELLLRLYARQAAYPLRRPENNFVVGFLIAVASADQVSFEQFGRSLRFVRQRHYAQARKWRVPEKDEGHPILDRWKPKPKRAYAIERALDYTLELRVGGKTWMLTEDVYRGKVLKRVAADQPVEPSTMMFDTPWLKLAPGWKGLELPAKLRDLLGFAGRQ